MHRFKIPFYYAADGNGSGADPGNGQGADPGASPAPGTDPAPAAIDYDKIQKMLDGTLAAKEDTALKSYFKQQGLSAEEAEQAIKDFKARKAQSQPDIAGMQRDLAEARQSALTSRIQLEAYGMAAELGVEIAKMPYILKLADLSKAADEKGKIDKEALKEAVSAVLESLPELKKQEGTQTGFRPVGADGRPDRKTTTKQAPTPTKRWNRFNY